MKINLTQELKELKELKEKIITKTDNCNVLKQRRRYTSKLDLFRHEILILHNELDYSLNTIRAWLNAKHNLTVSKSALHNRIVVWNKTQEEGKRDGL